MMLFFFTAASYISLKSILGYMLQLAEVISVLYNVYFDGCHKFPMTCV